MNLPFSTSLLIAAVVAILTLVLSIFGAFFSARQSRGTSFCWIFVQLLVVCLSAGAAIAALQAPGSNMGGYLAMSFATLGLAQLLCIYMLRNFMRALPRELFDTATVDGLSTFQQFTMIVLPRLGTIVAIPSSLLFIAFWMDCVLVSETVMAKNAIVEGVTVTPIVFEQLFLGCLPAVGVLALLSIRQFARVFAVAALQK